MKEGQVVLNIKTQKPFVVDAFGLGKNDNPLVRLLDLSGESVHGIYDANDFEVLDNVVSLIFERVTRKAGSL
jgi:hypothetical protein